MNLYRKYEGLSPIYRGHLTNHLPMVYVIFEELNVPQQDAEAWLDTYKTSRDLYELTDPTYPKSDLEQNYINQTGFYLGEINKYGVDVVVGTFLNKHVSDVQSALFHGLIRLAYAVISTDELLVAQALAYYEVTAEPREPSSTPIPFEQVKDRLHQLIDRITELAPEGDHRERLETLREDALYQSIRFRIEHVTRHREALLSLLLRRYQETRDFFVLHTITAFHALMVLEEFYVDFADVLDHFVVQAMPHLVVAASAEPREDVADRSFAELLANITSYEDAHAVKLLFSLAQLNDMFDCPLCRTVANEIR
mgnify:CR=1 FL=1